MTIEPAYRNVLVGGLVECCLVPKRHGSACRNGGERRGGDLMAWARNELMGCSETRAVVSLLLRVVGLFRWLPFVVWIGRSALPVVPVGR